MDTPPKLIFRQGQKLLFIGDSITDCGRRQPPHEPYGNGYVSLVRAFLLARYPALGLTIVNRGVSGNTVRDLADRWDNDVIALQPDWLSVKIGINDVWRTVAGQLDRAVPLDVYEATYRQLLARTQQETSSRLILMEPYVIAPPVQGDPVRVSGMSLQEVQKTYPQLTARGEYAGPIFAGAMAHFRALLDQYISVVHKLATEFDAVLVRTQAAFDEAMTAQPPSFWARDRVHPDAPGHGVIARAFLRAVGYGEV
jgi:lysophospholipase L1-like esterase